MLPISTCIATLICYKMVYNGLLFSDARAINVTDSGSEDTEAEHKNEFLFKPCDNATEFQCQTSSLCVPKYWLCDGTVSTIFIKKVNGPVYSLDSYNISLMRLFISKHFLEKSNEPSFFWLINAWIPVFVPVL